jgi:hypothetical protein
VSMFKRAMESARTKGTRRSNSCCAGPHRKMISRLALIILGSLIVLTTGQNFPSVYVTQAAAPPSSGGPGITVKQWNATGSNNQTTQFTLAVISMCSFACPFNPYKKKFFNIILTILQPILFRISTSTQHSIRA